MVVMGPPGVGKGTQAAILSTRLGVPHITTGQPLGDEIARKNTLGREDARYVDAGLYIPNSLATDLLAERVRTSDAAYG